MENLQTPQKIKLLSTKQVIEIATELEIWYDNKEMNSSVPAQKLRTKLKKFSDAIQLLTAEQFDRPRLTNEQFEDRIPDID